MMADPTTKSYQVADVFLKDKLIEPESKMENAKSESVAKVNACY
jgi:hypothetical protein